MKKETIPIALEGYPFILISCLFTLTSALLNYQFVAVVAFFITAFILYFFRDPDRIQPEENNAMVSPADGRVIFAAETTDDRFQSGKALKISIFMNVFNVHVNRIPFPGTVEHIVFKPGKFYAADKDKAALHNEYCAVTIRTDSGVEYTVVQVAGLIARRIVCRAEPGDRVSAGQRYGLIRFGSRVDLYLPGETKLAITKGQKVKAGETILGHIG